MRAAIGNAKTCPHGHPINAGDRIQGVPLADVAIGAQVRVLRFENEAEDLLHYLKQAGMEPGLEGVVVEGAEAEVTIDGGAQRVSVTRSVAETVAVLADPSPPPRTALPEQLVLAKDRYGRYAGESLDRGRPAARAGLEVLAVPLARHDHEVDVVAGGARRLGVAHRELERHRAVGVAVHERDGHAERQALGRIGDRVALGHVVRAAAEELPDHAAREPQRVRAAQVGDARLRERGAGRTRGPAPGAPSGRPARAAAHSASWPPAEWPSATTRSRSRPSAWPASRSTAAATSSNVCGQPPPPPRRRYSTFHTAQPRAWRSRAAGHWIARP